MWSKSEYIHEIRKIAKEALDKIDKEQLSNYNMGVKSILYYIGKSVLSIKYLKENEKLQADKISLETVEVIFSKISSNIFKAEELFVDCLLLDDEFKADIIKILKSLDIDKLEKISLGELYEAFITNKHRKLLGQVYTPEYIVNHMISLGISEEAITENPYFSVIDPACGAGYFLLGAYDKIKQIFEKNYSEIIRRYPELENEFKEGSHFFILKNNLTGFDIDPFAVFMTKVSLILKGNIKNHIQTNIFNKDILLEKDYNLFNFQEESMLEESNKEKYDLVIGNPPYIGHKNINKEYRKKLQCEYYDVYMDKADISYCFFKKGYQLLKDNSKLIYITSRYFLEAPSAKGLRKFLKSNYKIEEILDFYGRNIFKGIGISPVILKAVKTKSSNEEILVYRDKDNLSSKKTKLELNKDFEKYYSFQDDLQDSGWLLVKEEERELFAKIDTQGEYFLDQICICNQGIITGCDKAFIVDENTIEKDMLEKDICKPWVKNSEVRKYRSIKSKRYILYTNLIEDLNAYERTEKHISPYRYRLEKRRECLAGTRRWYELQWGRNIEIFKQPKILFPYKASTNEFTIEYREMCCSADVYILSLKDNFKNEISLEYLLAFLNSSLFEYYFKSVAKKLNEGMYEYYPNKLMTLKIKLGTERNVIENKVKKIMKLYNDSFQTENNKGNKELNNDVKYRNNEIKKEIEYLNDYFFKIYKLNKNEIDIIRKFVKSL